MFRVPGFIDGRTKQRCSRVKQRQGKDKKACCFLLIRRTSVLHVQFVFLLIRSVSLVVPV